MAEGCPGRTLVIQPLPGIGDAIWHLPHLRAIARNAPDGKVTLLTKPRSLADRLLIAEPAVEEVLWLRRQGGEHDGPGGFFRLVSLIAKPQFARVWVLHDSARYAQAAWAAHIPERHGPGLTLQRWFLNQPPYLPAELAKAHPIEKATRLLALKGLELRDEDRNLPVAPDATRVIAERYQHLPKPWIAFGLGSSEPFKQWGGDRFATLATRLSEPQHRSLFLIGGPSEREMCQAVAEAVTHTGGQVENANGLAIEETAALLAQCRLYVGNDTGVLNVAAAVGTPALGLFGGSPPLSYLPQIRAIQPETSGGGMAAITEDQVLAKIRDFEID